MKNKFALGLRVMALLIVCLLAGCKGETPAANPAQSAAQTDPATAHTLRLGLNIAAGSALHAAAERFASLVEQKSQGKLKIRVFPDQQLGTDDQMLEMARKGELDLLLIPSAKLSSAIPAMQYPDLPFYFSGREELYEMLDGAPGDLLLAKLSRIELVGLSFWENGFKQFTTNSPIRRPEDLQGLRMRTMKSPLIAEQFTAVGAKPIPIDFHATYQALKDGAVDGQENPLVAIVAMKFHEVQKHLTLSNHAYLAYVFAGSKQVFAKLSPDMRELLQSSARELTAWERAETERREQGYIDQIKAAGVEIYSLTPEERQAFSKAFAPIARRFGFAVGYDLIAKTEALRFAKQAGKGGRSPWIIGLDADLSARGARSGGAIYRGVEMAVDQINRQGGLLGAPVQMLALDHGANPASGLKNLAKLAELPNLLGVIGGMHSAVITAELPEIHQHKIPYLIPWAAAQGLIKHDFSPSFTFRVSSSDDVILPILVERAFKGHRKIGLMLEESGWGRSSEQAAQATLLKHGKENYEILWFKNGDTTLLNSIERLQGNGCEAIVFIGNGIEAGEVVRAMAGLDKRLPIYAHWALAGGNFWEDNSAALAKVDLRFVQSVLVSEDANLHRQLPAFVARYRAYYGLSPQAPVPAPVGTVQAYDASLLLAAAVKQARSSDRALIRNALDKLGPQEGILKRYAPAFTPDNHEALTDIPIHFSRYDDAGRIVLAE